MAGTNRSMARKAELAQRQRIEALATAPIVRHPPKIETAREMAEVLRLANVVGFHIKRCPPGKARGASVRQYVR